MFKFPWGDMHSLNLGWFLQKFNELRADWATAEENITGALDAEIQRAEDALSDVFDARDAAAASATAAAGSATAAGTSATAAQNSATAAASSATLANNKATAAGLSEAAAAQSATQAGNSATAAAGSATTASNAATNAAASQTAAAGSATAAAGSATAAATSETNAAASAARAEEVEQSIPADYTELAEKVESNTTAIANPKPQTQSERSFGGIYTSIVSSRGRVEIVRTNNNIVFTNLASGGNVATCMFLGRTKASQYDSSYTAFTDEELTDLEAYPYSIYAQIPIVLKLSTRPVGHAIRKLGALLYNSNDFTLTILRANAGSDYSYQRFSFLRIPAATLALYDRIIPFIEVSNTALVNSLGETVLEVDWDV